MAKDLSHLVRVSVDEPVSVRSYDPVKYPDMPGVVTNILLDGSVEVRIDADSHRKPGVLQHFHPGDVYPADTPTSVRPTF
ncbi:MULTISPECIES: hypothetical protein [Mycobacteroides]|uniref:Uncharacterized protein n=1 Tax=Mycobacteroides immunogenum TaxID=83262 RepID=A0A179VEC8_9MYCO|nr:MULTISPECIES: hypothetical protein [Mycobacteroides]OAT69371.1 hypothetical protein AWB85_21655 [Mycobacteroides immunogenum]SKT86186.1 Uncharacterised protein [Mycobacteroides abscessus subsp. massiliense]SKU04884.1 Uncharacterised protein [Mycobacteroides abscessus subsp. massiliense]